MRKLLFATVAFMLGLFLLVSCGGNTNPDETKDPPAVCEHSGGEANCGAAAVCEKCGESYGALDPDTHDYSTMWVSYAGYHYHECKNGCEATSKKEKCDAVATCSSTGSCSVCGAKGTALDPDNHKASAEWTTKDGYHFHTCEYGCDAKLDMSACESEGTCQTPLPCNVCGVNYIKPENHNISTEWTNEADSHYKICLNGCATRFEVGVCDITPTCVSAGQCSTCGKLGNAIAPDAHAPSEWITEGGTHYRTCLNGCGTKLDEGTCDITPTCTSAGQCSSCGAVGNAIAPNNHNLSDEFVITDTRHYKTCLNGCGMNVEEALHSFGDWENTTASTVDARGQMRRYCKICQHSEKEESPAAIMAVKGGAQSIVVLIHDDGTWNTVTIADELYKKYGLVGDAAITLKTAFMSVGNKNDFTDDIANSINVLKWQSLFNTGRWKAVSHSMTHTWWGTYDGNKSTGTCTNLQRDASLEWYEIVKSQSLIRQYFPGQRALAFAHPGFAEPKDYIPGVSTALQKYEAVYNEEARLLMHNYYIAARGTYGTTLDISDPQGTWERASGTSGFAANTYSDVWNYVPAYSLDEGKENKNMPTHLANLDSAVANGKMAVFFIHKLTNDISEKDASNTMYAGNYETLLASVSNYVQSGLTWNTFLEDAAMYLQEAETAKASVRISDGKIYVTLTDEASQFMLNEDGTSTGEEIFTYPLTVRVDVPEGWKAIKYTQGDRVGYAEAKLVDGRWVADAEIVPDAGEATVSEASLSDIPEPEESAPAVGSGNSNFNTLYNFNNGIANVVTSLPSNSGASTSVETVNGNNWLRMVKTEGFGQPMWILYGGYNSTKATSMTVSFKLNINEAILKTGQYESLTGNKRVLNISFGDTTPYALVLYRAISDKSNGASGKLYLADCKDANYGVIEGTGTATDNYIMELSYDTEYDIRVEMQMDGVNPFRAVIYVNDTKVKESSFAMNYTIGTVPTVEYVKFYANARGVFDILVDDVKMVTSFKQPTTPEPEPTPVQGSKVYENDFSSETLDGISATTANKSCLSISAPSGESGSALKVTKTDDSTTRSFSFTGTGYDDVSSAKLTFDIYMESGASVTAANALLYQIYLSSTNNPYILTIKLTDNGYVIGNIVSSSKTTTGDQLTDTLSFDKWYTIELEVNFGDAITSKVYVDGITNGTVSERFAESIDETPQVGPNVVFYAQKASVTTVYLDNIKVTVIE